MSQRNFSEIRIRNVGKKTHDELKNICDHLETNFSDLIKPKLIEMIREYPPDMKLPVKKD